MALPSRFAAALGTAADKEIEGVLASGGGGVAKPSGEVAAIAAVVLGGVPRIAAAWTPILAGSYTCSITGVFIHGSPQVTFTDSGGSPSRCELGDLLVVVDHRSAGGTVDRRANLVQAKLTPPPGTFSLARGGLTQLDLYSNWNPFRFVSPSFAASIRDFNAMGSPGHPGDSGRFGGVDLVGTPPTWGQSAPSPVMTATGATGLGRFIAEMATGGPSGRPATPSGADDWSATVDELLRKTAAVPSSFGGAIRTRRPRGLTVFSVQLCMANRRFFPGLPSYFTAAYDPPPPAEENTRPPRPGISVIYAAFDPVF